MDTRESTRIAGRGAEASSSVAVSPELPSSGREDTIQPQGSGLERVVLAAQARFDTRFWRIVGCLVSLAVLGWGLHRELAPGKYLIPFTDFQSFYAAALNVRHGVDPYQQAIAWVRTYSPTGNGTLFATKSYVYPPFFALLLAPLTFLSTLTALQIWDVFNLLFMIGAIYAAFRIAGKRPSAFSVLALAAIFSLTAPVRKEWFLGQTDIFLLCLICFAFWARQANQRALAGVLLALACVTKPTFIVLVVFLLWKREYKFAITTAISFLVLLIGPFLWLGGQTWSDQLTVWRFWSNQYVAYAQNIAPKGVLARLFTVNPVVRPITAAPILVTVGWLLIVLAIVVLTVAVVSPAPLRRDTRSLLEIGLVISALYLMSPLSEWPYLLVLAIPLIACYCWLSEGRWTRPSARLAVLGAVVITVLLMQPLTTIQYYFLKHVQGTSLMADVYVVLAPAYLYGLILAFALQFHVMSRITHRSTRSAVRQVVRDAPSLLGQWVADTRAALPWGPRTVEQASEPAAGVSVE